VFAAPLVHPPFDLLLDLRASGPRTEHDF
jgi:hypothetical protein